MKTFLTAAFLALCAPAFAQTVVVYEYGNFFDCCGARQLGNKTVVDASYMGMDVSECDPGGFTNCKQLRGQVFIDVSGIAYTNRCSPIYCYDTIPNPPVLYNATYDTTTGTLTETIDPNGNLVPVTDDNGNLPVWNCIAKRSYAPFECTTWQMASTLNFMDPSGQGYGTIHFYNKATQSWDTAQVRTTITWVNNPNYVPPPPPPSDE